MASMTLFISIWTGLIVAGVMMAPSIPGAPNQYQSYWDNLVLIYQDPITAIPQIVLNAFKSPLAIFLMVGLLASGAVAVTNVLSGGGFSLLFVIPLLIVMAMITIYAMPTTMIMNSDLPSQFKIIYIAIMGGLTLLTAISFMAGRG